MAKSPTTTSSNSGETVSIDDLSAQIDVLKNDIASLTGAIGNYGKSKGQAATQQVRETAAELSSTGRAKALEAQSQAEDFVRTQPAAALGIAAGIGFIVGMMTARR